MPVPYVCESVPFFASPILIPAYPPIKMLFRKGPPGNPAGKKNELTNTKMPKTFFSVFPSVPLCLFYNSITRSWAPMVMRMRAIG